MYTISLKLLMQSNRLLQAICAAGKRKQDLEQYTDAMSPSSRACVLGGIEQEIVALGRQYRDHVTSAVDGQANRPRSPPIARRLAPQLEASSDEEEDVVPHPDDSPGDHLVTLPDGRIIY